MTKDQAIRKLHEAKLYAILDTGYSKPEDWPRLTQELAAGGVGAIQIRAKHATREEIRAWAQQVLPLSQAAGIPLIINDYPEIAAEIGASGCHVGQDDLPVDEVRKIVGQNIFVGKSTHSLKQAKDAQKEGADYIGFGPIFPTATKPDYKPIGEKDIYEMSQIIHIPHFCIGGIKLENVPTLKRQGARRLVIVSGLLLSNSPTRYAHEVCLALT